MDAWAVYEGLQAQDEGRLTASELSLVALGDLRAEVNSGGFDRYLRYSGANTAARALAVCRSTTGLEEVGVLLAAALERLGQYSQDPDTRAEAIDSADLEFDDLDERFYDIESTAGLDPVMARLV